MVVAPFIRVLGRRIYAAIFSFCAGVIPPLPMFGRSLLLDLPGQSGDHQLMNHEVFYWKREQADAGMSL